MHGSGRQRLRGADSVSAEDRLENFVRIIDEAPTNSRSRRTRSSWFRVRFERWEEASRPDCLLERALKALMDRVLAGRPPPKFIGVQVHPPNFRAPYTMPLRPPEQNSPAVLADAIERLQAQSAEGQLDLFAGDCEFKVVAVWTLDTSDDVRIGQPEEPSQMFEGACSGIDLESAEVSKHQHPGAPRCQSLVRVLNPNDRWCLARAVLIGLEWHRTMGEEQGGLGRERRMIEFRNYHSRQHEHGPDAEQLMTVAGISSLKEGYGIQDAARLQQYLTNTYGAGVIRLVIFAGEQQNRIIYKGPGHGARFNLCLYHQNHHFSFLGRPEQLFRVFY